MDAVEIDTAEDAQNDEAIETTVPEVCRVCLLGNLLMRDLFVENDVVSLSTKAMSFASVKMLPGDGLPRQVCCECADKLDSAYEFKLQVEQADNVLRQRYDSLNIKEELFFNEVEVHLDSEGPGEDAHTLEVDAHYQATVDSLTSVGDDDSKATLLKDHLALLRVEKLAEQEAEDAEQKEAVEMVEQSNVAAILESNDDHAEYLHEADNPEEMAAVYGHSVKPEGMNDSEGITIEEHNYIMQQGYTLTRSEEEMGQDSVDSGAHESAEYLLMEDEPTEAASTEDNTKLEDHPVEEETMEPNLEIPLGETRRSKRKLLKRSRTADEDNYFENLNLSSRLKKTQSDRAEKVFLCYLCDEQFGAKEMLKRHMNSHEEVRRALSVKKSESIKAEKRQSTPTRSSATPIASASSSGKRANKCPYCGKEYLYVISFNKHLKQHERNKDSSRDESAAMSLEENLQGDESSSDFGAYDETRMSETSGSRVDRAHDEETNDKSSPERKKRRRKSGRTEAIHFCDRYNERFSTKRALEAHAIEYHDASFKCSTCDREFESLDKLRRHRSQHVLEGVLTEQDVEDNIYEREFDVEADGGTAMYESSEMTETHLEPETEDHVDEGDAVGMLENTDWQLDSTETETETAELEVPEIPETELKCPNCPMSYSHKKSLARHMESHEGASYSCKICAQKFTRKDCLQRHVEQHSATKSFKCTECAKVFGNELTLRNHLIATNHKTIIHGQEYDPNKRLKRVAAKAAQKIIDKIKTEDGLEEYGEEEDEEETETVAGEGANFKGNSRWARTEEKIHPTASSRKAQHRTRRRVDFDCETCGRKCSSKASLTKHMEQQQHHGRGEKSSDVQMKTEKLSKSNCPEGAERGSIVPLENNRTEDEEENSDENSDFGSGLDWPTDNHECPTCKKKYSTKKSLLRHQLLHEEPNFECDICSVKFYRKDKLKAHYDKCSEKNPDQVRKCNICGDIFLNNEILKEHRSKHVDEGILTEEDLRDIEPGVDDRKESGKVARKRRTDIVGLECTECNKRYTSRKGLLRHIQVHEGKKYLCDICPKKFYRREHLKIHVAKHNMIKPYKCTRCTKRFIKEDQLANHLSKHDRTFKKTKETDSSKRFLCEICSKSFTQSTTLIAHLRAHNGIKPYVCEVCARPFTTNAYLKMHMRTHTQERPYSCQYCSRAFARADTLANHLTSHTGEAKYHCKYCPKNFRRLKSLKEHVFIHTGQRPYACPTCDRRFNNNGSRYAHSKRCKQNLLQSQSRNQTVQNTIVHTTLQQPIRIHQITADHATTQMQVVKSQSIKTITIARPTDQISAHQVMQHQEILMPLILPLTVTLTDVDEEVILPEGTKIFTTA